MKTLSVKIIDAILNLGYEKMSSISNEMKSKIKAIIEVELNEAKDLTDNDYTRDVAIRFVGKLVEFNLVTNCTDTDNEEEFDYQDTIHDLINEHFEVKVD